MKGSRNSIKVIENRKERAVKIGIEKDRKYRSKRKK
jgi:hypothetical protein